ncbi:hypothetical protein JCM10213v2_006323 [Rhodosporidiobolus nylandii]
MPVAPSCTLRRSGRLQPYANPKQPSAPEVRQASPTSLFLPPTVKACRVVSGPAVVGRKAKVDEEAGGEASGGVTEKGKVPSSPYPTVDSSSRRSSASPLSVRFDNRTYEFPARPLPPRSLPPSPPLVPLDAIADVLRPPLEPPLSFPPAYLPPPAVQLPPFYHLAQAPPAPSFNPPPLPLDKPQGPSIDELSCGDLLNLLESLIPAAGADDLAVLSSPRFLSFVGLPAYSPPPSTANSCPSSLPSTPHSATFPAKMDERLKSAHLAVSPEGRAELILVDTPIQSAPATAVSATSCVKELMGLGLRFERA